MANDVNIKFGASGEQEFKNAIKGVDSQIKNLQSEMALAVSEMTNMDDAEEASARQMDILQRTYEATQDKVKILSDQYDSSREKLNQLGEALQEAIQTQGEGSAEAIKAENAYNAQAKAVNDLGTRLNGAQKDLNDVGNKMNELANGTEDAGNAMDKAGKKALSLGDIIKANITGEAIIQGVKELAKGLKELALGAASYADEILTASTQTGLSTDALQEYKYMEELVDTSLETITGSMAKLTKTMSSAQGGTGAAAEAFATLGVSVTNTDGTLRSNQDVFNDLIDALGTIDNATERDALSMQIFGKSAQQLNPLIDAGSKTLKAYAQEAHDVGYVMSGEMIESNAAADDALQRLTKTFEAVKNSVGTAIAPALEELLSGVTAFLGALDDPEAAGEMMGELIAEFIGSIADNLPMLINGAVQMITGLANGLSDNLDIIIEATVNLVVNIVTTLINNVPKLVEAALRLVDGIARGLIKAIPTLIKAVPDLIKSLLDALGKAASSLIEMGKSWGKDLLDSFVGGIKDKIETVKEAVKNVGATIKDFLGFSEPDKGPLSNFHTFAPDMMELFTEGIYSSLPDLARAAQAAAGTIAGTTYAMPSLADAGAIAGGIAASSMASAAYVERPVEVIKLYVGEREIASAIYDPLQEVGGRRGASFLSNG